MASREGALNGEIFVALRETAEAIVRHHGRIGRQPGLRMGLAAQAGKADKQRGGQGRNGRVAFQFHLVLCFLRELHCTNPTEA